MKKITFLFLITSSFLSAQQTDWGAWGIYIQQVDLPKNFTIHNEVQYRSWDYKGSLEQLMIRNGIGYNLTEKNNNILLGYGYILSGIQPTDSTHDKSRFHEHRLYQQYIYKHSLGRVFFQHRYRFEERFLKNDFKFRIRYFLAIAIPLNKPTIEKNALYLSLYNELFINTSGNIFDRNRLYGALGYAISDRLKLEIGAMSQIYETRNRPQFQIALFTNLN
jgi:hypothetical protein